MEGILLLNKPKGMTSHDCVFKIRKLIKLKKVGHTGTLDPDVSGVLPICIGRATKIAEFITGTSKTYEAEVTLGFSTTTEDASGEIVEKRPIDKKILRSEIEEVFSSLTGEITQVPPMFSAVKINGVRLYEYARKGIEVERPSRRITIHELQLLDKNEQYEGDTISFSFRVTCSKGTYVRTLAVMIGEKLGGYPAHMSDLKRTASGKFTLDQCLTIGEVEKIVNEQSIHNVLHTIESGLSHLPNLAINDTVSEKIKNGAVLPFPESLDYLSVGQPFTIVDRAEKAIAIYERHPSKADLMKPVKVLVNNQELA